MQSFDFISHEIRTDVFCTDGITIEVLTKVDDNGDVLATPISTIIPIDNVQLLDLSIALLNLSTIIPIDNVQLLDLSIALLDLSIALLGLVTQQKKEDLDNV